LDKKIPCYALTGIFIYGLVFKKGFECGKKNEPERTCQINRGGLLLASGLIYPFASSHATKCEVDEPFVR